MALKQGELSEGLSLKELKRSITQENINLYAAASGDFNPIHTDLEFARRTPLGGTIAHGMLLLAYVSEFMTSNIGQDWLNRGSLSARFKSPVRPGDTITISGRITEVKKEDGFLSISCDVLCQNQQDELLIICETKVRVKTDEDSY
jgi:acyl dehydratase